jgi:hypothetical protein
LANNDLNPDAIAVVSNDQLSTTLSGEVVILGLRDALYYGLDDVGARIWDLVQTPRSLDQIVDHIVAAYDVGREAALPDVARLLIELRDRGLVTIDSGR